MTTTRTKRKLADASCIDNSEETTRKRLKLLQLDGSKEEKIYSKRITDYEFKCLVKARIETKINTFQKYEHEMGCQKAHSVNVCRLITHMKNVHSIDRGQGQNTCQVVNKLNYGESIKQLEYFQSNRKKFCECLLNYKAALSSAVRIGEFKLSSDRLENFIGSAHLIDLHFTLPRHWHRNLTNETVKSWLEKEGNVYVARHHNKRSSYGKVTVKNGLYWVSNLASQLPEGFPVMLSLTDLLNCYGGPFGAPKRAFLQVGDRDNIIGEITVAMDDVNPRFISKLFLSPEIKEKSFKTKTFLFWAMVNEENRKITYNKDLCVCDNNDQTSLKNRFLFTRSYLEKLSRIRVATKHRPVWRIFCKFGIVKEGVQICQEILEKKAEGKFEDIFIHDYGLVL